MPIARRVIKTISQYTHTIETAQFSAGITVKSDRVTDAAPQLHWTIGHRYDKVRETCSLRNWKLEKIEKKSK